MRLPVRKGQAITEYALLIAICVAALIAMRGFMTRSVQSKFRTAGDAIGIGEQYARGVTVVTNRDGEPYSPGNMTTASNNTQSIASLLYQIVQLEAEIHNKTYTYQDVSSLSSTYRTTVGLSDINGTEVKGLYGLMNQTLERAEEVESLISSLTNRTVDENETKYVNASWIGTDVNMTSSIASGLRERADEIQVQIDSKEAKIEDLKEQVRALGGAV